MSFLNAPGEDQFLVENTCTSKDTLGNLLYSRVKCIFKDFVQLVEDLLCTDFDCNCQISSFGSITSRDTNKQLCTVLLQKKTF